LARIRNAKKGSEALGKKADAQIWRIAVYIRLSREDGNDESESVVNQKKILTEYLEKHFEDQYVVVDYYMDDGLTGTDDTRKEFMRLIHDIDLSEVNCMVVKTLARAFRNYSDQGYYLEYFFPQKNVRFISVGDPVIDTYKNPDIITGLEVPITGLMNDRYSARTSSDIRRTFNMKRRNGEFIGAFPPYGYLKDPENKNRLILDPEIASLKREMRGWIVQDGMSLGGVARKLNELGVPNPTAYKHKLGWQYCNPLVKENDGLWVGTSVKHVLLNQVNLGHMVQGKQRVVSYKVHDKIRVPEEDWFIVHNTHEPTFTQEEYDALENVLARDTRTPNGSKTVHLFSGFLRCSDCNKALQRRTSKGHTYYACRTHTEKSKERCTKHSIRLDILEEAVLQSVRMQIALIENLAEVIEEINQRVDINTQSSRIESLLKARHQELAKMKNAADSLYVDWKAGELTAEDYRRMKQKFDDKVNQIAEVIANLEEEQRVAQQGVTAESDLFLAFAKHGNIAKLDRGVLIALVDTIYVHEDKGITIKYRYADQYERTLEYIEANMDSETQEEKPTS